MPYRSPTLPCANQQTARPTLLRTAGEPSRRFTCSTPAQNTPSRAQNPRSGVARTAMPVGGAGPQIEDLFPRAVSGTNGIACQTRRDTAALGPLMVARLIAGPLPGLGRGATGCDQVGESTWRPAARAAIQYLRDLGPDDVEEVVTRWINAVCDPLRDAGAGSGQRPQRLKYQSGVLDRFEQIRMTDVEYTAGTEGSRVFVTSHEDCRQGDGTPYKNVYVFRFVLRGGLIVRVDKYANPVTYAKLAGLPIG